MQVWCERILSITCDSSHPPGCLHLRVRVALVSRSLYCLYYCLRPNTHILFAPATIPISIDTVVSTGEVSDGVARFVIPLGSSVNMDGGAVRIICNTIWLAYQNGIVPTAGDYILLVMCSTLGSMGAAPVPNASLVLVSKSLFCFLCVLIKMFNVLIFSLSSPFAFLLIAYDSHFICHRLWCHFRRRATSWAGLPLCY